MKVEVVYALPDGARVARVDLPSGATLRDALAAASLQLRFELNPEKVAFGIFGKRAALGRALADGDRVEIYRPLEVDPKEARRRRAARKR